MTHQEDATAFLKAKLEDRNPKCGNCKFWNVEGKANAAVASCDLAAPQHMPDLSLCSAWEKKE